MPAGVWADSLATLSLKGFIAPFWRAFRPYPVTTPPTANRPQLGEGFSKWWTRGVNLEEWVQQPPWVRWPEQGVRTPTCSAGTISQWAGHKIQAARGERCSSNVGMQTLVELEESRSSKSILVKAPPGCHGEHPALALLCSSRWSILAKQLPGHPNSLRPLFLEPAHLSRRKTGMETHLKAGLSCLEPRFTGYL